MPFHSERLDPIARRGYELAVENGSFYHPITFAFTGSMAVECDYGQQWLGQWVEFFNERRASKGLPPIDQADTQQQGEQPS